jgi:multiple sugar transport system ATP-binding protein
VPPDKAALVRRNGGARFVFGIRPEDIRVRRFEAEEGFFTQPLKARVNVIEPLGKELFVDLSANGLELAAIVGAACPLRLHEEIELVLNMDKMHLFEPEGEERAVAHTPKNATSAADVPRRIMDQCVL